MLPHFIFVPGQPGWLDAIDRGIEVLKPAGWKGYTIGDNTHKETSRYPWRMDDPTVTYRGYEKFIKSGSRIVAVHKGLFPPSDEQRFPSLTAYAKVDDVGKAAQDWPQLDFLIYHGGYRYTGDDNPALAAKQFDETGRMDWVSDLAEVAAKFGVKNVYADVGASFAALCLYSGRDGLRMRRLIEFPDHSRIRIGSMSRYIVIGRAGTRQVRIRTVNGWMTKLRQPTRSTSRRFTFRARKTE
jgi:hypothetical protein